MKNSLLFVILSVFIVASMMGQQPVPNGDFEEWETNILQFQSPIGWANPNSVTAGTLEILTVYPSADVAHGDSSVFLETRDTMIYIIPGLITLGDFVINLMTATAWVEGGIPFTDRPLALTGSYKSYPAADDFGMVIVQFTKYDSTNGVRDTIAAEVMTFPGTVDTWTNFSIPIVFNTEDNPDTMNIIVVSSNMAAPKADGSMYIDNLAFEYEAGINDIEQPVKANIFPNPASEKLSISFEKELNGDIKVFSNDGQLVYSTAINGAMHQMDVSELASGNYYFAVFEKNKKMSSGQFVISR